MHKLLRTLALVIAAMMVVYMIGCGDDDDDDDEEVAAAIQSTTPATGGNIAANGVLTIVFDNPPGDVSVNGTPATVTGKTATWNATGLTPGQQATINITWTIAGGGAGSVTLNVEAVDDQPPKQTGGTVSDGDKDVDPEPINSDGITLEFDEDLAAGSSAKLTLEDGTDTGFLSKVEGNKLVIEPVAGKSIGQEQTYKITGKVTDGVNEEDLDITFVTKAKEQ